jgi:hypothetical protein
LRLSRSGAADDPPPEQEPSMKKSLVGALVGAVVAAPLAAIAVPGPASAAVTTENFDVVTAPGWTATNNSNPVGSTSVFQGTNVAAGGPFDSQAGAANSYAGMNYNSTSSSGTISTWLVTPQYTGLSNGDVMSFYTRKVSPDAYPDRLEVRMSTDGACSPGAGAASVGDFTTVLATVNPTLVTGVYPTSWTQFTLTLAGIAGAKTGCFAFRYFVTNAGLNGSNGDYIGIDTYAYDDQPTDVTAPSTAISSAPNPLTSNTSATFDFTSNEAGTFECSMDGAPYAACSGSGTHTVNGLADGPHTFGVRAVDLAGNADPTPATASFTVDATAPDTLITAGPATGTTTADSRPTFEFDSTEGGSTFQCNVDSAGFVPCSSPLTTATLGEGARTFAVRATDAAGNTDATPASSSFTVDLTAPDTAITSGPATGTSTEDTTPTFGFSSNDAGAIFTCSVDGAAFGPCSGPAATHTTAVLALGAHVFSVRATDASSNTDATPATSPFTVVAPSATPADCSVQSAAVAKAKAKVAKAKAKLKKDKKSGTATAIKKARTKLKKARLALKAASAALTICQAG